MAVKIENTGQKTEATAPTNAADTSAIDWGLEVHHRNAKRETDHGR
jgi:hypothetical protein